MAKHERGLRFQPTGGSKAPQIPTGKKQRLPLALPLDTKEPLVFLLLAALSSGLLIAISSLSFLYIEKPGMAAGKRLVRRLRQRTRTTSQVEPE